MKTISAAQSDYWDLANGTTFAASLERLAGGWNREGYFSPPLLDSALGSGVKSGYIFEMTAGCAEPDSQSFHCWSATAYPVTYKGKGTASFYIDQTGIIRAEDIGGYPGIVEMPNLETYPLRPSDHETPYPRTGLRSFWHFVKRQVLEYELTRGRARLRRLAEERFPDWRPAPYDRR